MDKKNTLRLVRFKDPKAYEKLLVDTLPSVADDRIRMIALDFQEAIGIRKTSKYDKNVRVSVLEILYRLGVFLDERYPRQ